MLIEDWGIQKSTMLLKYTKKIPLYGSTAPAADPTLGTALWMLFHYNKGELVIFASGSWTVVDPLTQHVRVATVPNEFHTSCLQIDFSSIGIGKCLTFQWTKKFKGCAEPQASHGNTVLVPKSLIAPHLQFAYSGAQAGRIYVTEGSQLSPLELGRWHWFLQRSLHATWEYK